METVRLARKLGRGRALVEPKVSLEIWKIQVVLSDSCTLGLTVTGPDKNCHLTGDTFLPLYLRGKVPFYNVGQLLTT